MRSLSEQQAASEEAEKEKKSRRRQNRRPNQNSNAVPSGRVFSSVDPAFGQPQYGIMGASPAVLPSKASEVAFSSLPTYINDSSGATALTSVNHGAHVVGGDFSRLSPLPSLLPAREAPKGVAGLQSASRKCSDPHWSGQAVEEALKKGRAYRAAFRVNAHNRLEAYCTVEGLPIDILIDGAAAQNRAIEGDIVAITLNPLAHWTKLKGSNVHSSPMKSGSLCMVTESRCIVSNGYTQKEQVGVECESHTGSIQSLQLCSDDRHNDNNCFNEAIKWKMENGTGAYDGQLNGHHPTDQEGPNASYEHGYQEATRSLERICSTISLNQGKRPTGRVVSIIKPSPLRGAVVGFLSMKHWLLEKEINGRHSSVQISRKNKEPVYLNKDYIPLIPTDPKFPKMLVNVGRLPDTMRGRLKNGDATVERELVAAQIDEWNEGSLFPRAHVIHFFGQGGEIEPHIGAIMFENAISNTDFSPESLTCLPDVPWKVPNEELKTRKDLRSTCTFTIDPPGASDLDDALSVEVVSDKLLRVGVHIADASYFVRPDTALDTEAEVRSTSVYIIKHKLPMLPPKLSEEVGSLIPGVDRLAFSVIWDFDCSGNIVDRWIGRSVINSCCKMSYDYVQDIIEGAFEVDQVNLTGRSVPQLHGQFELRDVFKSLRRLYETSKKLKEVRFKDGALSLDNTKLMFLFDESGTPYESFLSERKESCSIVEEFMLLANRSVAEVISRAFPDSALLRRHPQPNLRKLKEFEAFCAKHGFQLETSSSGKLHLSLSRIREGLKNDPVLFDILISYASRPMQSAAYFCTGDLRGNQNEWGHYALSVPFYTHFTSPLRRYPDIIVHRTLSAVLEAEETYLKQRHSLLRTNDGKLANGAHSNRCFTGLYFDKHTAESKEGREALSAAASKFKIPKAEVLSEVAAYCNARKLASRHAEEAGEKLYLWALLKKRLVLVSEARVVGLGPRFMSVYVQKFARIYYDEVDGLIVEWLDATCTLIIDLPRNKGAHRRGIPGKFRTIEDVALVMNTAEVNLFEQNDEVATAAPSTTSPIPAGYAEKPIIHACFPLVLRHLSTVPIALHAVGGHDGPVDIAARLYMCSYLK